jgi:hypothetical protein
LLQLDRYKPLMASQAERTGTASARAGESEPIRSRTTPSFSQGIAFVHGIGEQKCGESLRLFGEAFGTWLQQWLTKNPDTDLRVTRAEVEPPSPAHGVALSQTVTADPTDPDAPAHTVLTICRNGVPDEQVLIVECWWADAFEPPKLRELVVWLSLIAPYLVMTQAATPLARSIRRLHLAIGPSRKLFIFLRMIPESVLLLLSVVLIPVLLAFFAALLLPALIPVASLQQAARRAATLVIGYLGDAFIVTVSPIRRDLITNAVQADLAWLGDRCKQVAVVAHSQGAVITHDALRRKLPPKLKQLVTIGSGIEKLLRLRLLFRYDRAAFARQWIGVGAAGVVGITGILTPPAFATGHRTEGVVFASIAAVCLLILITAYFIAFRRVEGYEELAEIPGAGTDFQWFNYYASSDPVPNGPLVDGSRPWIEEREVFNYGSIVRDHTTYLKNREQVLPRMATILFGVSIAPTADDIEILRRARTRRRLRTRFLAIGRALILAAGVAATAALWSELGAFGSSVRRHLPAFAVTSLRHLFAALPSSVNTLQGRGVVAWLVAWLVAYGLFALCIFWWGQLDVRAFIKRESADATAGFFRELAASLTVVILVTLAAMALTSGLSDNYLRGLEVSSGVLAGMVVAAVVVSWKLGRAWLPRLETTLTKHWLDQAGAESTRR